MTRTIRMGQPKAAIAALRDEGDALYGLVAGRSDAELQASTPHRHWRVLDLLVHLGFVDWMARLALAEPERYRAELAAMRSAIQRTGAAPVDADTTYRRMSRHQHTRIRADRPQELVIRWRDGLEELTSLFERWDPAARIDWFGRPMKLERLIAARQMEVWAYGQDAFDTYGVVRQEGDRLQRVADFCVRTFALPFVLRGLPVPDEPPAVTLVAPSGAEWQWHDPRASDRVAGTAVDFCLVVTQRRHVLDTGLTMQGPVAERWMAIAQCIAGPPSDAPPPGTGRRII